MQTSFEKTTIHGVADLFTAKNFLQKCFWVVISLIAFALMAFEMAKLIIEYRKFRVSTSMQLVTMETYPKVAFCPTFWINTTKATEQGLDEDDLRYFMSHFDMLDEATKSYVSQLSAFLGAKEIKNKLEAIRKKLATKYGENILTANNFQKLVVNMSYDETAITINTYNMTTVEIEKLVYFRGVCYQLSTKNQTEVWTSFWVNFMFGSEIPISEAESNGIQDYRPLVHYLFVGDDVVLDPTVMSSKLAHGRSLEVHISSVKHKKFSTKLSPCESWTTYKRAECITVCVNRFLNTKLNCSLPSEFGENTTQSTNNKICNNLNHAFHRTDGFLFELNKCVRHECPRPCIDWFHETTVAVSMEDLARNSKHNEQHKHMQGGQTVREMIKTNNATETETTEIKIYVENIRNTMVFEEFPAFTWETLLCNLGGILSLFFGASILSLVQILTICFEGKIIKEKNPENTDIM